jgi:hypothetical protein
VSLYSPTYSVTKSYNLSRFFEQAQGKNKARRMGQVFWAVTSGGGEGGVQNICT